jgi:bacterioferritin
LKDGTSVANQKRNNKGEFMDNTTAKNSAFDVNEIRRGAALAINQGAVTMDYPLNVKQACKILNEALASEILCVLRYRHHQVIAKGINFPQVAAEFKEHAASEEEHVMQLAERIDQLGGDPDMNPATITPRSPTEYGSATDLIAMIKEDLVAERIAIDFYRQMVQWFQADPTTRRLLEKILADEEEHATDLADLLVTVEQKKNRVEELT